MSVPVRGVDLDAIKKRHLDPEKNRGRTYYVGHIEVDLATVVEEAEWLHAEVAWLRAPILHDEVCANCGHTKFRHREYRDSRTDNDMTKCWGRGFDCDDCSERCDRFVRFTHDGQKP